MLFLSTSRELLFHIEIIGTPNEVWVKFQSLFKKIDEMRGHHLENELVSLSPAHYETIEYFFNNFKVLLIQLKQCGIENKYDHLIFSILYKLGHEYSLYVSTFHSSKLTTRNWKMPAITYFMEPLTQEKDNIIQMSTIKYKYQALYTGVSNQSQSKKRDLKQREKEEGIKFKKL